MKHINKVFLLIMLIFFSCKADQEKKEAKTSEPFIANEINENRPEGNTPPTYILMHNRMGVRIEYTIDNQQLELWFSPKAGESVDIFDRNFSNRDDHTCLFDKIVFPNINPENFIKCDYDPFHSVIYFRSQILHLASLFDQPVILLWFEEKEQIDIKTDKSDTVINRKKDLFYVQHPDRGYVFDYLACLGEGNGFFQHQLDLARGRSTYTRVHMAPGQVIAIAGDMAGNEILSYCKDILARDINDVLESIQAKSDKYLDHGKLKIKDNYELQKFFRINKKSMLAEMDASGYLPASIKKVGCLPYIRDGGWAFPNAAYTGWTYPLEKWNEYLLSNPTVIRDEEPKGKMFGQLVGPITKWEEDGNIYAVWGAFAHWQQTGDDTFVTGQFLNNLGDAIDWLERYCYDEKKKLFGRYYYTETAFKGSRDAGWDNAIGCASTMWQPRKYNDKVIARSYDIFINMGCYSTYLMLAAMDTDKAYQYLQKAKTLENSIEMFFTDSLPLYGNFLTNDGNTVVAGPYGIEKNDYVWGLSIPRFYTDPVAMIDIRKEVFDDVVSEPEGYFAASYYSLINSMDPLFYDEDILIDAILQVAEKYYDPGKYMPMAFTIGEQAVPEHGNYYTDIRPMPFPAGPMMYSITGLGIRKLPFGIAVRSAEHIAAIDDYEYKENNVDFSFSGKGEIANILLNGEDINHTWQIPESFLDGGDQKIEVVMKPDAASENTLVSSTVQLKNVRITDNTVIYNIVAYGKNVMVFKKLEGTIIIKDDAGLQTYYSNNEKNDFTFIEFNGRGKFNVLLGEN